MKNDFKSFLAVEFSNYLQLLLSAGRSTRNHEIMLRSLDSFLLQMGVMSVSDIIMPKERKVFFI